MGELRRNIWRTGLAIIGVSVLLVIVGAIPVEKSTVLSSSSSTTILGKQVYEKYFTASQNYQIEGAFQASALIDFAVMTENQFFAWGRRGHPNQGLVLQLYVSGGTISFNAEKGTKYYLLFVNYHSYPVSLSINDITGKYSTSYSPVIGGLGVIGFPIGLIIAGAGYVLKPPEPKPKLPPPPQKDGYAFCDQCGQPLRYIPETGKWFCQNCKRSY